MSWLYPALWNRNYLFRFRFRFQLSKSYGSGSGFGSGSYFWKVMLPVPVPVSAPYLDHKKQSEKKNYGKIFAFLLSKLLYKVKVYKFH